jgi:hypothetical protein
VKKNTPPAIGRQYKEILNKSTDTTIIYPMEDMDKFGEFLGYPKERNRYVFPDLDIF